MNNDLKTVFSSDVELSSDSVQALKAVPRIKYTSRDGNSPAIISGVFRGKALTVRGSRTTETKCNNTVVGYEPTDSEPFEFTIFDGDQIRWASGSVSSFQYLIVKRK